LSYATVAESPAELKLSEELAALLCCPACRHGLARRDGALVCACGKEYPVARGIPVVIDETKSVFDHSDFTGEADTFFRSPASPLRAALRRAAHRLVPDILIHLKAEENYREFTRLLATREMRRVLILGGSIAGAGMGEFLRQPFDFVESDVSHGPRTSLICDGHDIPFPDQTFDAVIAQGVLEHVADSERVVEEAFRVLKPDGLIYAETPFMQPGHFTPYDFRRFSLVGHRRLFRRFEVIREGAAWGPAASLTWNYKYFLLSLTRSAWGKSVMNLFAHYSAFWLKYFDHLLIDRPDVQDAASGFYFMGRKSEQTLTDRELIAAYRPC
jgi:SAM-dependent methyltransferase